MAPPRRGVIPLPPRPGVVNRQQPPSPSQAVVDDRPLIRLLPPQTVYLSQQQAMYNWQQQLLLSQAVYQHCLVSQAVNWPELLPPHSTTATRHLAPPRQDLCSTTTTATPGACKVIAEEEQRREIEMAENRRKDREEAEKKMLKEEEAAKERESSNRSNKMDWEDQYRVMECNMAEAVERNKDPQATYFFNRLPHRHSPRDVLAYHFYVRDASSGPLAQDPSLTAGQHLTSSDGTVEPRGTLEVPQEQPAVEAPETALEQGTKRPRSPTVEELPPTKTCRSLETPNARRNPIAASGLMTGGSSSSSMIDMVESVNRNEHGDGGDRQATSIKTESPRGEELNENFRKKGACL
ncbi:hypothetical protein HDU76_006573 [Blyttiomyces sp. JEL0837]|nr:hypothetical protein HDU76_006573 [Blyttiomyces sp. JEL0837]